jgi:hypothetical protein
MKSVNFKEYLDIIYLFIICHICNGKLKTGDRNNVHRNLPLERGAQRNYCG